MCMASLSDASDDSDSEPEAPAIRSRNDIVERRNKSKKRPASPTREPTAAERKTLREATASAKAAQTRQEDEYQQLLLDKKWMLGTMKKKSGTSEIWTKEHFVLKDFLVDGKKSLRSVCTLCGYNVAKASGTGNEHRHLLRAHPEVHLGLKTTKQPNLDALDSKQPVQSTLDSKVSCAPRFVDQAMRWLTTRMYPFNEVESDSFRSMMAACAPKAETLTSYRVRQEVVKLVAAIKSKLRGRFSGSDMKAAITTDAWTSKGGEGYICLTLHFVDRNWVVQSLCTGLLYVGTEGHGALPYAAMLVVLLEQAGLAHGNVEVLVTDSENTMNKLGKDLEAVLGKAHPCKCHGVELCVKPWSEGEGTRHLMGAVRRYITAFSKSTNAMAALKSRQKASGERPRVIQQVVKMRWWSDYIATLRLELLRPHLDVDAMDSLVSDFLTGLEWEFVHQSNEILEAFRDFQIFFEGQFYVTLSWLPLMLEKLRLHLEKVAAELADPQSKRRQRRQLRQCPDLVTSLAQSVEETRENFIYLYRDKDERFVYDRDNQGRLCGVPTKAWHAALLDIRTKNLLGFLTVDERTEAWNMLEDEVFARSLPLLEQQDPPSMMRIMSTQTPMT